MKPDNPMRRFDPRKTGALRKRKLRRLLSERLAEAFTRFSWLGQRILRAFVMAGNVCRLSCGSRGNCLCAVPGE